MRRAMHILLSLVMLIGLTGLETTAAAQADDILDLANIPLTVQELPEDGYQVLAGGYLSPDDTASLIAGPRNLDETSVNEWFGEVGLERSYVLDLVLPEDRAWQESPAMAVVQTSLYLVNEESGADDLFSLLQNYANTAYVTEMNPAVDGAFTISMAGEGGDQLRTIVSDGRLVIEIVSIDATGSPDETEHILIVEATVERLNQIRSSGEIGLSPMVLRLMPGEDTANFGHSQQTGVHGLYRFRDSGIQPAVGEMGTEDISTVQGLSEIYTSSGLAEVGGGTGLVSIWLADFDSASAAESYFNGLIENAYTGAFVDPFYNVTAGETWTEQGVLGLYRVTGILNGENYSGIVEIRQVNEMVVAIGYRTIGAALPGNNITNSLMDHQLGCLESRIVCPPFRLMVEPATPQASPVVEDSVLGSAEFGWTLPELGPDWIVDEQFTDPGYDRFGLRNGVSIFEFESVINHHGDPLQCVMDEQDLLEEFEEHSVITVWEDPDGNTDGGRTDDHAWITYRVEPLAEERADQEYVIRIDCFSLLPDSANLVMRHIAPVDYWVEEQSKGESLRNSISFPESSLQHGKLVESAHDRRTTMIYFHDTDQVA